jgi:hypothetical protein
MYPGLTALLSDVGSNFRLCNLAFAQARLTLSKNPGTNLELTLGVEHPCRHLPREFHFYEDFCRLPGCGSAVIKQTLLASPNALVDRSLPDFEDLMGFLENKISGRCDKIRRSLHVKVRGGAVDVTESVNASCAVWCCGRRRRRACRAANANMSSVRVPSSSAP